VCGDCVPHLMTATPSGRKPYCANANTMFAGPSDASSTVPENCGDVDSVDWCHDQQAVHGDVNGNEMRTWPMQMVSTILITGSAIGMVSAGTIKTTIWRSFSNFQSNE
jgi:hypothetical protein